jgi:thymidylate kinase
MKAYSSRGCLIAFEGSPNSAAAKLLLVESYLDLRNLPYVSYQFQDEDPLGQMVYDIENCMFTCFSPETQFLLQCADFYQHAQKIEEELRKGTVVLISKYIKNATCSAQVKYVNPCLFEAVKDLPIPDHTFLCDFSPLVEYELAPYHHCRSLSFIEGFRNFLISDPPDDATVIPHTETNEEFLLKLSQLLREFY